jgi:hypothetical protein
MRATRASGEEVELWFASVTTRPETQSHATPILASSSPVRARRSYARVERMKTSFDSDHDYMGKTCYYISSS